MSVNTDGDENTATDSRILTDQEIETVFEGCRELEPHEECRQSQRWAFSSVQSMAPCDDYTLPGRNDFRPVRCHDLSVGGIALVLPERPDFEYAVVALGTAPNQIHLVVRVAHHRPAPTGFIVGCRFIRKVELPS
jgi:hypothetical protein